MFYFAEKCSQFKSLHIYISVRYNALSHESWLQFLWGLLILKITFKVLVFQKNNNQHRNTIHFNYC